MKGRKLMAQILLEELPIWGVRLERRGGQLIISPASKCPGDLKARLREHKAELLDLLEAKADGLAPDCAPWLHVGKQVLAGEFDNADGSTRAAVAIGLSAVHHPVCKRALEKLQHLPKEPA